MEIKILKLTKLSDIKH